MLRVRVSRAISRRIFGDTGLMVCTHIHTRRHWLEPWIDRLFFWDAHHCRDCAQWEIDEVRKRDALDDWRRSGWL